MGGMKLDDLGYYLRGRLNVAMARLRNAGGGAG
jgi:hypothetical protein